MLSMEEKQALLIQRWERIRKEGLRAAVKSLASREVKPKPPSKNSTVFEYDKMQSDKETPLEETAFDKLARAIWEASGRDLKSIVPEGKKNSSWYLLNLKSILEWHGNVAIGEDKQFDAWINVVPPNGCTICYFGPGALDRARAMARKIMGYYP